jgi:hypothetical protein
MLRKRSSTEDQGISCRARDMHFIASGETLRKTIFSMYSWEEI